MGVLSSKHFKLSEFRCPHCGVALVRPDLLAALEELRARLGRPVPIVSGYRCPPHNADVGGASNSQHMYAAAADLPDKLATISEAKAAGFTGIGSKGDYAIHVDVRDGPLAMWTYPTH
jgi:uncharacterized protein YcbK (DUF882 family)